MLQQPKLRVLTNVYFSFEHLVKHLREFAQNATMTSELFSINSDGDITIRVFFAPLTTVREQIIDDQSAATFLAVAYALITLAKRQFHKNSEVNFIKKITATYKSMEELGSHLFSSAKRSDPCLPRKIVFCLSIAFRSTTKQLN